MQYSRWLWRRQARRTTGVRLNGAQLRVSTWIRRAWQRPVRGPAGGLRLAIVAAALVALALAIVVRVNSPPADAARTLAGQPAPAFSLVPVVGTQTSMPPVTLASERGHPVLLVFTYTLCPHCLSETRAALSAQRQATDLRVLLVDSPAESPAVVAAYLGRVQGNTGYVTALLDSSGVAAHAYHVGLSPTTFLIDRSGVVRDVWVGETGEAILLSALRLL